MNQVKLKPGRRVTKPSPWKELYESIGGEKKLADHLGVSKSTIGKWANNVHRVPVMAKKELLRLCEQYGIKEGLKQLSSS